MNSIVSALFALVSVGLFATLVVSMTGVFPVNLGLLFYNAFSYATFYLPLYVGVVAYLIYKNKATRNNLLLLSFTFIPFITLSLVLKTLLSDPTEMSFFEQALVSFFDGTATLVLSALLVSELLVLARIAKLLSPEEPFEEEKKDQKYSTAEKYRPTYMPEKPFKKEKHEEGFSFPIQKEKVSPSFESFEKPETDSTEKTDDQFDFVAPTDFELDEPSFYDEKVEQPALKQPEVQPIMQPVVQPKLPAKSIRESLEEVAYGNPTEDNFAFLDSDTDLEKPIDAMDEIPPEAFTSSSKKEFLDEFDKLQKSEDLIKKPLIDVEEGFKERKKALNAFQNDDDPAFDFLKEPSDNIPPHLNGALNDVLSPEEEVALSQLNQDIAMNTKEESQMAELLEDANKRLDEALEVEEMAEEPDFLLDDRNLTEDTNEPTEEIQKKNQANELAPQKTALETLASSLTKNTFPPIELPPEEEEFVSPQFEEQQEEEEEEEEEEDLADIHFEEDDENLHFEQELEDEKPLQFANETLEEETPPFESQEDDDYNLPLPIEGLLEPYNKSTYGTIDDFTNQQAATLENTLREFNIEAKVIAIRKGPVVTMFELLPSAGVKLSKIEALSDNIAFRLAASRVRIVAPIPGKQAVGIEIPNAERSVVTFSELVSAPEMADPMNYIPIALGKDIEGKNQVIDLTKTPHLLIAGSTGSGKSVCVNSIICSILYTRNPHDVRLILVDPKVVELKPYNDIPHLLAPVITEPKKALQAVQWAMMEMERRYGLLDSMGSKNIRSYNQKIKENPNVLAYPLPYIVLVIDEFADLIASCGKELEMSLARLAAKSRASGIHLILATQRPSADVITGLIKANFPSRIAFMVPSKVDSRVILDTGGADQLLGKGDMLFVSSWNPFTIRMQSAFLSEEEVDRVTAHIKTLGEPDYIEDEMFFDEADDLDEAMPVDDDDPLFDKALEVVIEQRKASASYLQRRLKIGYNRAARLVELMEERGIIGPANGSKPRELLRIPT